MNATDTLARVEADRSRAHAGLAGTQARLAAGLAKGDWLTAEDHQGLIQAQANVQMHVRIESVIRYYENDQSAPSVKVDAVVRMLTRELIAVDLHPTTSAITNVQRAAYLKVLQDYLGTGPLPTL